MPGQLDGTNEKSGRPRPKTVNVHNIVYGRRAVVFRRTRGDDRRNDVVTTIIKSNERDGTPPLLEIAAWDVSFFVHVSLPLSLWSSFPASPVRIAAGFPDKSPYRTTVYGGFFFRNALHGVY